MPLLGTIIQQCRTVFAFERGAHRPNHPAHTEFHAQLKALQETVDQLRPHHIGLDEAALSPFRSLVGPAHPVTSSEASTASDTQRKNRVAYYPILEESDFEIGAFFLPARTTMPLHDHPDMMVIGKVLQGTVKTAAFDWFTPPMGDVVSTTPLVMSNLMGEVIQRGMVTLDQDTPCSTLFPDYGNIHFYSAITDCILFDIQAPPYNADLGRDCRYFVLLAKPHPGLAVLADENTSQISEMSSSHSRSILSNVSPGHSIKSSDSPSVPPSRANGTKNSGNTPPIASASTTSKTEKVNSQDSLHTPTGQDVENADGSDSESPDEATTVEASSQQKKKKKKKKKNKKKSKDENLSETQRTPPAQHNGALGDNAPASAPNTQVIRGQSKSAVKSSPPTDHKQSPDVPKASTHTSNTSPQRKRESSLDSNTTLQKLTHAKTEASADQSPDMQATAASSAARKQSLFYARLQSMFQKTAEDSENRKAYAMQLKAALTKYGQSIEDCKMYYIAQIPIPPNFSCERQDFQLPPRYYSICMPRPDTEPPMSRHHTEADDGLPPISALDINELS